MSFLDNYEILTAETSDYVKIGSGIRENVPWIVFHSPTQGFALHANWLTEGQDKFSEELFMRYCFDHCLLAGEIFYLLRDSGDVAEWVPDASEADVNTVLEVVETAGGLARTFVDELLENYHSER